MKIVPIVSVHDALIGYKNIVIDHNTGAAIRGFSNSVCAILDGSDGCSLDIRDLSLYHIGNFDIESGEIIPHAPKLLITGTEIYSEWKQNKIVNSYNGDDPFEE